MTQYFFAEDGKLIFVLAKKYQILNENGYLTNLKQISESKFYYTNEKLYKVVKIPANNEEETDYLKEAKSLIEDLKEYK